VEGERGGRGERWKEWVGTGGGGGGGGCPLQNDVMKEQKFSILLFVRVHHIVWI
jgi:hypothetical protein